MRVSAERASSATVLTRRFTVVPPRTGGGDRGGLDGHPAGAQAPVIQQRKGGGMSGTSSVDFTTLYQAAKDVRSVKDEISGEVRNFDGTVGHMLSGWRGSAATAFQGLAGQWQQDIGRVLLALEGIADALEKSAGMHQQT